MRIALAALAALSLTACSKPADQNTAAPAVDANAATADTSTAPAPAADTGAGPQADAAAGGNPAVKDPHPENAGPAAKGANSFTEGQARGHIENSGYTNVTALAKDANGHWHGTAMKNGKTMNVSLDFKGNVVTN